MPLPFFATRRKTIVSAGLAVAVALLGLVGWWLWRSPVGTTEVAAFLDRTEGGGRVSFSHLKIGAIEPDDAGLRFTVEARGETVAALYSRIDAEDYLRRTLHLELPADERRLLEGLEASRKPEDLRRGPVPPDPYRAVIVQLATERGLRFAYRARISARRSANAWDFSLLSSEYDGGGPKGETRAAFAGPSYVAGDTDDDARLRVLAADLSAFANRAAEVERSAASAHDAALTARETALLARLAAGSVFRGAALRAGEQQGTPLYLEITGLLSGNAVTALLRNSGGWRYARAFQGTWSADPEFQGIVLDLSSSPDQAVRNAGSILENTQPWSFSLRLNAKGELTGAASYYEYKFKHVNPAELASIRSALSAEVDLAQAATVPGALFHGTATVKASGASEPILLRFTAPGDDREAVQASVESTSRSWKRSFAGSIIANSRRSEGRPIHLKTESTQAVAEAPADSVLGIREDLALRLGVEGRSLAGEDDRFIYRLNPAEDSDVSQLDAARTSRADRFKAILRAGIAYDGLVRDDQGSVTPVRLEISQIDAQRGTVAASIHSLTLITVYQDFVGSWNPADASVTLASTGHGEFDFEDDLAVPFLVAAVPKTLQLALVGNAISGGIKEDPHWTLDFPVAAFLTTPTEALGSQGHSGVLPDFPKAPGAYALIAGSWQPLPRNNGHVVVETKHVANDDPDGSPLGLVSAGVKRITDKGQKVPYLEFDGKEPRPECPSLPVVVLFNATEPNGDLSLELAPTTIGKEGRRRLQVVTGAAQSVHFGEQRVAAYVRRMGANSYLLTPTAVLPPGTYAVNADHGYELVVRP
jgi:hypothetical protein